jgi:hypothetical protein
MVTGAGVEPIGMLWLVPDTAVRVANSGREPKALKAAQLLEVVRHALAEAS